jgi:hypothetical protein
MQDNSLTDAAHASGLDAGLDTGYSTPLGDAGLKTHVDAKHKGVTFKCEDCGKEGFSTKGALTRHIKNACPRHPDRIIPNPYAVAAVPGAPVYATVIGKKS